MATKQVIVIRKDLNMRKGKMIAQGAHASMKVFFDRSAPLSNNVTGVHMTPEMKEWAEGTFTKIVVYVESEEALLLVASLAKTNNLPYALIQDSGFTEFHGVLTYTAVAVGPANSDEIDKVTGDLPLL